MRSEFYYVVGVHVFLRYDNRSKTFQKGRVGGSIVINIYWKTGNYWLKTNTLSPLCITIYIYMYINIRYICIYTYIHICIHTYTPEFNISVGSTVVKIYPFVSLRWVNKDKNM